MHMFLTWHTYAGTPMINMRPYNARAATSGLTCPKPQDARNTRMLGIMQQRENKWFTWHQIIWFSRVELLQGWHLVCILVPFCIKPWLQSTACCLSLWPREASAPLERAGALNASLMQREASSSSYCLTT